MIEDFLAVLAPLLGKCFAATFAPGLVDTHCFKPLYDGAHVEDRHVVTKNGTSIYEGLSIYSATPDGLFLIYVNTDGGSGSGKARVKGSSFDYTMTMRASATGESRPLTGSWTIRANGYDAMSPGQAIRKYRPAL